MRHREFQTALAGSEYPYSLGNLRFACAILFVSLVLIIPSSVHAQSGKKAPKYVGVEACKKCHLKEYTSFMTYARKSKSFQSIERIRKRLTEDELKVCYACHTTGYGKPGGFVSEEKTPHLKIAGCEVCHGPGEHHTKTADPRYISRPITIQDCETCHTEERVKAFRYKPLIHGGAH